MSAAARPWADMAPAERLAAVRRLRGEKLSATAIAGRLGTTKNAVLGLMHRAGLSVPRTTSHVMRRPKNDRSAAGGRTRSAQVHAGVVSLAGSGRDRQSAVGIGQSEESVERVRLAPPRTALPGVVVAADPPPPGGIGFHALDALFARCLRPLWGAAPLPLAEKRWCGAPTVAGQSYCAACLADLTAPPSERLRRQTGEAAAGAPKSGRVTA